MPTDGGAVTAEAPGPDLLRGKARPMPRCGVRRAVEAMSVQPVFALVDGNYPFVLPCPVKTVVGGDAISISIAAASILAKTARDRLMKEMDEVYPGYGFAGHKGYRAQVHARA